VADPSDDEALLLGFLAARDTPCPVCSYNLRGLKSSVCPECAARLHLAVGSENLRLGAWFVGIVSFALALGFDGVVSLIVLVMVILHPPPSPGTARPILMILGTLVPPAAAAGTGLGVLFAGRRTWRRMPLARQWTAALTILSTTGVVHLVAGLCLTRL
jgi:hypothetical protein